MLWHIQENEILLNFESVKNELKFQFLEYAIT